MGALCPVAITWPSRTTTAPTGTSPAASARRASSSASDMKRSSLIASLAFVGGGARRLLHGALHGLLELVDLLLGRARGCRDALHLGCGRRGSNASPQLLLGQHADDRNDDQQAQAAEDGPHCVAPSLFAKP